MVNLNERKATARNIKPHLIRLGGRWIHEIIYNIIREIWNERQIENVNLLNESKVVLLFKNVDKRMPSNYRLISLRHMILNILDR